MKLRVLFAALTIGAAPAAYSRDNLQLVLKGDPANLLIDKNGMRFE